MTAIRLLSYGSPCRSSSSRCSPRSPARGRGRDCESLRAAARPRRGPHPLGFGHAKAHGHRRIIVAIPFASVVDRTAAILGEVLGARYVLEHHSAIDARETRGAPGSIDAASGDKMRFAMKNWAAVMTAHGQLFESLFCALPSRKLHDIAGSSIVLDEAKALPRGLLVPTVRMIGEIARSYGCSIAPCTATRPAQVSSFLSGPSPWRRRRPWCGGWRRAWRRGSSSGTWRWLR